MEWLHDQDFPQIISETWGLSVINVLAVRVDRVSLSSALSHTWEKLKGLIIIWILSLHLGKLCQLHLAVLAKTTIWALNLLILAREPEKQ